MGTEKKISELTDLAADFLEIGERAYDLGYDAGFEDRAKLAAEDKQKYYDAGFAAGTLAALGQQYRHLTN